MIITWKDISPDNDLLNTRQIIEYMSDLEGENTDWDYASDTYGEALPLDRWDPEAREQWIIFRDLIAEVRNSADESPESGVTLVRETYWTEYVRDYYAETYAGDLYTRDPRTHEEIRLSWDDLMRREPLNCIDWDRVARIERTRHAEVIYGNVAYMYRSN